ncbi:MAG: hypothetical protein NT084_05025 [Bacteroidetes bacterium]|jgi:hypothetical protein|nr:hypothetical protein [Bacteroidota bacterium]
MSFIFPQYRRYLNGKNYFRIDSLDSFEEIRSLGERWLLETHNAKILPDFNLINDLLHEFVEADQRKERIAETISSEMYNSIRNLAV